MVLSDRFGGMPRRSLLGQTLLYVLGFGFGALLVVGVLSFTMVSIAEGLLPDDKPAAAAGEADDAAEPSPAGRAAKKPKPKRANEASDEDADQPL